MPPKGWKKHQEQEVTQDEADTPAESTAEDDAALAVENPPAEEAPAAPAASAPGEVPSDNAADPSKGFPVEDVTTKDGQAIKTIEVFRYGRVAFRPLPADHPYAGRRIVWFPKREHVDMVLAKNPPGTTLYIEPADVLSLQEVRNVEQIVDRRLEKRLKELGLLK